MVVGFPVGLHAHHQKLEPLQADDPDLKVVVKGADTVDCQIMVNVLDVLRELDITKVGPATEDAAAP